MVWAPLRDTVSVGDLRGSSPPPRGGLPVGPFQLILWLLSDVKQVARVVL